MRSWETVQYLPATASAGTTTERHRPLPASIPSYLANFVANIGGYLAGVCQMRTGSVFSSLAGFAQPWEISSRASECTCVDHQAARFTFRFCPACGTNLHHSEEGYEDRSVSVAVDCFADESKAVFAVASVRSWSRLCKNAMCAYFQGSFYYRRGSDRST